MKRQRCLVIATVLAAIALRARAAELRDIRAVHTAEATRLVFDLGEPAAYELRRTPAHAEAKVPPRLYLDLRNTRLAPTAPAQWALSGGPLLRWRGLQLADGSTRVILDVPGLREYRAVSLTDPFRLVVMVYGTPRVAPPPRPAVASAAPSSAAPVQEPPAVVAARPVPVEEPSAVVAARAVPVQDPPVVVAARAAPGPVTQPPAERARRLTVVLDPGHGGNDPGARGVNGTFEKDIVLHVTRALGERLEAAGYKVIYTRDRDVFLSLQERAARANDAHADLFVSIHANASPNPSASGIETYYLSNTNDRATIRLAQMENHLAHMTGRPAQPPDISWILSDMIQKYKVGDSLTLAERIQQGLVNTVRRRHRDARDLGVKPGPFYVLVGVGMPAVLVELSFLTHGAEAVRLADPDYQAALADGLLSGIRRFVEYEWMASTL